MKTPAQAAESDQTEVPERTAESLLDGVRVLELGNYIAAPTAGRLLADFGATVIKIERPGTGDELRRWRLYQGDTSLLFRTINRNKKSVSLDLSTPAGRDVVLQLVEHSDVLIENFRPGTLERWGLGPEALQSRNPDLVLCRISAFGQTGPMANQPGFAAVAEGYGGMRALVGEPDRPPARVGVSIGDSIAGIYAAFGAVMQLFDRQRSNMSDNRTGPQAGELRHIDVALSEAIFSVMESLVPDYEAFGVTRERLGGRVEGIAPSNAYACRDGGSVIIAGNSDSIFARFMRLIGRTDLAEASDLRDNAGRWARRDELDEAIATWTSARSAVSVLAALAAAQVPAGPIYTAAEIARDPQFLSRNMIQKFSVSTGDEVLTDVGFPGIVPLVGPVSAPVRALGPELGEHTFEVLKGILGMSEADIALLTEGSTENAQ